MSKNNTIHIKIPVKPLKPRYPVIPTKREAPEKTTYTRKSKHRRDDEAS